MIDGHPQGWSFSFCPLFALQLTMLVLVPPHDWPLMPAPTALNQIECVRLGLAQKGLLLRDNQFEALLVLEYFGAEIVLEHISEHGRVDSSADIVVRCSSSSIEIDISGAMRFVE